MEMELARLVGRGGIPLYLLAAGPLALFGLWALTPPEEIGAGEYAVIYAALFQAFLLRLIVFFGCVAVFSNAFRREIMNQTLHYSLLAPIRRDFLVLGKYAAGVLAAGFVFTVVVALTQLLFYAPMGYDLVTAQMLRDGLTYLGLTALAVVGYGALFLAIGLYVRNPIIPAALILAWESVNFILPSVLQKLSVIHYLEAMSPVPVPDSPFAIPVDPTPAYLAVPGLLVVSGVLLWIAVASVRRLEVNYGVD
jgi:ABC-type transport system involved in multi-copper enzyme maturation permease subunit